MSRLPRALLIAVLATGLAGGLAACGKKGAPKPPAGEESRYTYPNAYPAPETVNPGDTKPAEQDAGPLSIFTDGSRRKTTTY